MLHILPPVLQKIRLLQVEPLSNNPLSPNSDQRQFSPNDIRRLSRE